MKILITGQRGFIGRHLTGSLTRENKVVDGWDIKRGKDIFAYTFDKAVKNCDVVYHLAALTSVDKSFKNPDEVFITNVLGTARVAYLCAKYKKKLIYPSSAAIYHRELSPYAESKALAEDIVRGVMESTPTVVLRLYNVFGEGMNPNSGSIMYNFLHDKVINVYGDGEQTRDYIHVRDVVSIMKDCLKKKWDGKIVDVGTGQHYTANYVAGLFAHFRNLKLYYKPPRREIKWSIANTDMLFSIYSRDLTTNLQEDIKELCNQ